MVLPRLSGFRFLCHPPRLSSILHPCHCLHLSSVLKPHPIPPLPSCACRILSLHLPPLLAVFTITVNHRQSNLSILPKLCFETLALFLQHDAPPQKHTLDFLLSTPSRFSHPTILVSCRIPVAARRFCLCSPLVFHANSEHPSDGR
jgi:hypothetical protein